MGDLDDAIREHLELKRKHGASEEEVVLKQREAQRQGALPSDPGALPPEPEPEPERIPADRIEPEPAPADPAEPEPAVSEAKAPEPFQSSGPFADELDPDEVLPEEALEAGVESNEDPLEETPEFLEDMPEQDRLWFEQRPPKDFDFDD
jgi:hypothetical protein